MARAGSPGDADPASAGRLSLRGAALGVEAGGGVAASALVGARFIFEDEQQLHPGGDWAFGGANLGVDRDQQSGETAERNVRPLGVLEPRDARLIDPGEVLDLALGEARVHASGPDLVAEKDHRVVGRAMVALAARIDTKPLLKEPLVHGAIELDHAHSVINPGFTDSQPREAGSRA